LFGPGGAVLKFLPDGAVHGISTDYPFIKRFDPGFVTVFNRSFDTTLENQHGDLEHV
ncbi:MAG: hypothetical protein ACI9PN_001318, partial [Candidatus Azotimanducaceae bacterium]